MDRKLLLALSASIGAFAQAYDKLSWWYFDDLKWWVSQSIDQQTNYQIIKDFNGECAQVELYMADVTALYSWVAGELQKEVRERMSQKAMRLREADRWDVEFVNEMFHQIEMTKLLGEDLIELMAELDLSAIQAPVDSLQSFNADLLKLTEGSLKAILLKADEENVLALTDRMIDVPEPNEPDSSDPVLEVDLTQAKQVEQSKSIKPKYPAIPSELIKSVENNKGGKNHLIKVGFQTKHIDVFKGIVTGIVMPAGSPQRKYLDGDWFPAELIQEGMYGYMLNSPYMNTDHNPDDLYKIWEHPDFALIENYIVRGSFMLGGDMVQVGDWVQTVCAKTDEARQDLKDGVYNGCSIEAWVGFYPDELIVRD